MCMCVYVYVYVYGYVYMYVYVPVNGQGNVNGQKTLEQTRPATALRRSGPEARAAHARQPLRHGCHAPGILPEGGPYSATL